ncbi:MAG: hypothetical protein JKY50_13745 [Oleispira sp.]|nr:hypothetical protein [Oleispira sp.]
MNKYLIYLPRAALIAIAVLLSGCGDELSVDNSEQQEQAIAENTAFAYVVADINNPANKKLMVRDAISSSAAEIEILNTFSESIAADAFAEQYDVQNLTISQDGETLLFSAHNLQDSSSWNLYQYHFKNKQLQRIISDDEIANLGNDTHGIFSGDLILFSSDRGLNNEVGLYAMELDGSNIIEITQPLTSNTSTQISLLNLPNKGINSVTLEKGVDQEGISAAFKGVDDLSYYDVMQGSDGRILALAKNPAHPMQGGDIVQLQGPAVIKSIVETNEETAAEQNAIFEYLVAKPLSASKLVSGANDVAVNGWYSAYWPYRDGTSRMLVSWSQCVKNDGGISRGCDSQDSLDGIDARYGLWVFDVNNNTRLPVLQAQKNRIYTEVAVAYPNLAEELKFDDIPQIFPKPTDPKPTDPKPTCDNDPATALKDCPVIPQPTCDNDPATALKDCPVIPEPTCDNDPTTTLKDCPVIPEPTCDNDPETTLKDCPVIPEPTCDNDPTTTLKDCPVIPTPTCDNDPTTTLKDCPVIPEPTCDNDPETTLKDCPVIPEPTCDNDPTTTLPACPVDPENNAPIANAGLDVDGLDVGATVMLDGSASSDADGDTLTYSWRVISSPVEGDINILTDATAEQPTLTLLKKGFYVIELTVNDGKSDSETDTVMIEAVADDQMCVSGKKLSVWSAIESEGNQNKLIKDAFLGYITSFQGVNTPDASYDYYSASAHPTFVNSEFNDALPQPKDSSAHIFFYESKAEHAALTYSNDPAIKTRGPLDNGDLFLYFFFNKDAAGQSDNKVYFEVFTDNNLDEAGISIDQVILADDGHELVSFNVGESSQHYIGDYQYWYNTDGGVIGPFRGEEFTIAVRATSQSPVGEDLTGASFFSREGTEYNFFKDPKITSFIITYKEEVICDPIDPSEPEPTNPEPTEPEPTEPTEPEPTVPSEPDGVCHGKGYWSTHNRYATNPALNKPWPISEDSQMCGTTWHNVLNQPTVGDAWTILSQHYVTAKVNEANLAGVPQSIADVLLQANTVLANCTVAEADREFALGLKDQLEAFTNNDCVEVPIEPTDPTDPTGPTDPTNPEVSTGKTFVHIETIYYGNIAALSDPTQAPMSERSARFIRVLVQQADSTFAIKGYSDIQPDGSALFQVPANTSFKFEVVNARSKALNEMAGSDYPYQYFQRLQTPLEVAEGETLHCVGYLKNENDDIIPHCSTDEDTYASQRINHGASAANTPWANANSNITASNPGDTMAQALQEYLAGQSINSTTLSAGPSYQDYWTPEETGLVKSPSIDVDYSSLTTNAPTTIACQEAWNDDCVITINYANHIQPLWEEEGRGILKKACVDCHDNRGFTRLNLKNDLNSDNKLAAFDRLFDYESSYMYILNRFSVVLPINCRRLVEPPFAIEPTNDCFTCYSQRLMSHNGAVQSGNFFDVFDYDTDDDHSFFRPVDPVINEWIREQHRGLLTAAELRMVAEWLDQGGQY